MLVRAKVHFNADDAKRMGISQVNVKLWGENIHASHSLVAVTLTDSMI